MGLKTMSLLAGATITASGGTALGFAEDGIAVQNGLHLIVPADADYVTRRQLTAKYRPSVYDAKTGLFSKEKKSLCLVLPFVLPDGRLVYETLRIERELYPTESSANATELLKLGAQLCIDGDVEQFWLTGSLS